MLHQHDGWFWVLHAGPGQPGNDLGDFGAARTRVVYPSGLGTVRSVRQAQKKAFTRQQGEEQGERALCALRQRCTLLI